jgi:DNA-binding Xre family transcriptional regulator
VRFHTLERICEYLDCEPGDILRLSRSAPGEAAEHPASAEESELA